MRSDVHEASSRAWDSRPFRRLWLGSAVSVFGSEIGELALPLLALLTLSAGAGELSAIRTAQFLPFLIATLPLGVLVDRVRRRPLMVQADLGRFVLVAAIPVSVWAGFASIPLVCGLVFLVGTLTVLYQSADFALLPQVVTPRQLTDANAKVGATASAAEISGRGLGGVLVQVLTAPVAVLLNAFGYLVSALSVARIPVTEDRAERGGHRPVKAMAQALRLATSNPVLRGFLGGATTFNLFNEVFFLCLMLYLVEQVAATPALIGAVLVAGGVGSFLGAWFGAKLGRRFGYGKVLITTLAIGNTAPLGSAFTVLVPGREVIVLVCVFLVMGAGIGISNAHVVTVRQVVASPSERGRLNAAYRLVSWGAIPAGALLGGVAAGLAGPWAGMVIGAAGMATATLWVGASPVPRLHRLEDAVEWSRR
jgi:MFS family permease